MYVRVLQYKHVTENILPGFNKIVKLEIYVFINFRYLLSPFLHAEEFGIFWFLDPSRDYKR
jgi:hypothetical protein